MHNMATLITSEFRDYLDGLLREKETPYVEFKHAKGGFPASFWESYSAFANTEGGIIAFGVKERNGEFFPDGLSKELADQYKQIFWDTINNPNKVSHKLLVDSDVISGEYDGNHILLFNIARAARESRPVYIGPNPFRGTYRRDNSGDYLCKEREVTLMFAEQRATLALDSDILEGFSIDDLDQESLRAYRQLFTSLKPSHPWAYDDDITLLRHLKAYRVEKKTGKEGLTLAGLLMFGKGESITDADALPHFMIDYREYNGEGERWSDRIYNDLGGQSFSVL